MKLNIIYGFNYNKFFNELFSNKVINKYISDIIDNYTFVDYKVEKREEAYGAYTLILFVKDVEDKPMRYEFLIGVDVPIYTVKTKYRELAPRRELLKMIHEQMTKIKQYEEVNFPKKLFLEHWNQHELEIN